MPVSQALFFVVLTIFSINNIICICRLTHKFIFSDINSGAPNLVAGFIISCFLNILFYIYVLTGQINTLLSFMTFFYFIFLIFIFLSNRLMAYKTVRFNIKIKFILYITFISLRSLIVLFSIPFIFYFNFQVEQYNLLNIIEIFNVAFLMNYSSQVILVFIISSFIIILLCLIFDFVEKRSKLNKIIIALQLIPMLFMLFFVLFPITNVFNPYITFLIIFICILIPYTGLNVECKQTLLSNELVDLRINKINEILKKINPEKKLSGKQLFQIKYIKSIFDVEQNVKDICLSSIFSKKRKIKISQLIDSTH